MEITLNVNGSHKKEKKRKVRNEEVQKRKRSVYKEGVQT